MSYPRIATFKTAKDFRSHLSKLGIDLPFDDELIAGSASPLAQPLGVNGATIGNRFAILPMEGWDGTSDGHPSDLTFRRWQRFGTSGAKLIWGGEAVAVRHDGRANPNQLLANEATLADLALLPIQLDSETDQHAWGSTARLAARHGLTWQFCRPPVIGLEYEMDCRAVAAERVIPD